MVKSVQQTKQIDESLVIKAVREDSIGPALMAMLVRRREHV